MGVICLTLNDKKHFLIFLHFLFLGIFLDKTMNNQSRIFDFFRAQNETYKEAEEQKIDNKFIEALERDYRKKAEKKYC